MSIPKDPSSISLCAAYLGIINKTKAAGRDVESVLLFGSDAYAVEQIGPRFTDRVLFLNRHTIPWVHHTHSLLQQNKAGNVQWAQPNQLFYMCGSTFDLHFKRNLCSMTIV